MIKKIIYILLTVVLVLFDQLTKEIMYIHNIYNPNTSISLFNNDALLFTYIENHGGIFGLFQGHIRWFTIISLVLIIYIVSIEYKNLEKYSVPTKIAICFLASGAIGNMLDRLFRGFVIDMINFQYIWKFVFNVADMYIHIGIYILIIYSIFKKEKKE